MNPIDITPLALRDIELLGRYHLSDELRSARATLRQIQSLADTIKISTRNLYAPLSDMIGIDHSWTAYSPVRQELRRRARFGVHPD